MPFASCKEKKIAHPPGDGLSLKSIFGEEAGLVSILCGKEDGIGVDVGDKEEQELDDWQKQPRSVQPKNAWLQSMDVATT